MISFARPDEGFEQLHICGRSDYLLKASLLSHGYTVVGATTAQETAQLGSATDR